MHYCRLVTVRFRKRIFTLVVRVGSAPCASRRVTISCWPICAAMYNGVNESCTQSADTCSMIHAPESGNRRHKATLFSGVCHAYLAPDFSGTRFRRRLEHFYSKPYRKWRARDLNDDCLRFNVFLVLIQLLITNSSPKSL